MEPRVVGVSVTIVEREVGVSVTVVEREAVVVSVGVEPKVVGYRSWWQRWWWWRWWQPIWSESGSDGRKGGGGVDVPKHGGIGSRRVRWAEVRSRGRRRTVVLPLELRARVLHPGFRVLPLELKARVLHLGFRVLLRVPAHDDARWRQWLGEGTEERQLDGLGFRAAAAVGARWLRRLEGRLPGDGAAKPLDGSVVSYGLRARPVAFLTMQVGQQWVNQCLTQTTH